MGQCRRAAALVAGVALSVACTLPAGADFLYKNDKNPVGVPDIDQGAEGNRCFSAAFANAMWYFDQAGGKAGLFPHTDNKDPAKNWQADAEKVVTALHELVKKPDTGGPRSVLEYIREKRANQDVVTEVKTYKTKDGPKDYKTTYLNWGFSEFRGELISNGTIENIHKTPGRFGILAAGWHEKGAGEDVYLKINGTKTVLGHELTIAGRDTDNKRLIVSNGWRNFGDGDEGRRHDPKVPVDRRYYDRYEYTMQKDSKDVERMRITDKRLVGELGGGKADYAEVRAVRVLDSSARRVLSTEVIKKDKGPEPATAGFDVLCYNQDTLPVREVEVELPLRDPQTFSKGLVQKLGLPDGWDFDVWNPNDRDGGVVFQDDGPVIWEGYDFIGLRFFALSPSDMLFPGEGALFSFELLADLLGEDFESRTLLMGAWDEEYESHALGLGGNVPEPGSLVLLLAGLALAGKRGRAEPRLGPRSGLRAT